VRVSVSVSEVGGGGVWGRSLPMFVSRRIRAGQCDRSTIQAAQVPSVDGHCLPTNHLLSPSLYLGYTTWLLVTLSWLLQFLGAILFPQASAII